MNACVLLCSPFGSPSQLSGFVPAPPNFLQLRSSSFQLSLASFQLLPTLFAPLAQSSSFPFFKLMFPHRRSSNTFVSSLLLFSSPSPSLPFPLCYKILGRSEEKSQGRSIRGSPKIELRGCDRELDVAKLLVTCKNI